MLLRRWYYQRKILRHLWHRWWKEYLTKMEDPETRTQYRRHSFTMRRRSN
ncbi:hypothetical protein T06_1984, partial [Trichinella sp. T6]